MLELHFAAGVDNEKCRLLTLATRWHAVTEYDIVRLLNLHFMLQYSDKYVHQYTNKNVQKFQQYII